MPTDCTTKLLGFAEVERRAEVADSAVARSHGTSARRRRALRWSAGLPNPSLIGSVEEVAPMAAQTRQDLSRIRITLLGDSGLPPSR